MMQSVAIAEVQHSESSSDDFIMVEQPDELRNGLSDDYSYDYCDDVFSVHSEDEQPISLSLVAADDKCTSANDNHPLKEMLLAVPSVLMKGLDEAHAAAKLAQIPDLEQSDGSDTISTEAGVEEHEVECNNREHHVLTGTKPRQTGRQENDMAPEDTRATRPMSRASNKKRRKKLKMLKKAQAAATAAQALSEKTRMMAQKSSTQTKTKGKITRPVQGRSSRKVASIAVACATETLSAYREEVFRSTQQCA